MTVSVRQAVASDAHGIQQIGHTVWPRSYSFAAPEYLDDGLRRWWSTEAILRGIATTTTLVVVSEDGIIGTGNIDTRMDPPVIWKLYVLPDWQGLGIGSRLLSELLASLPQSVETVALEYLEDNMLAAQFYASKGFEISRREENDVPGWPARLWARLPRGVGIWSTGEK